MFFLHLFLSYIYPVLNRLEKMLHSSLLADRANQLPDELLYGRAGCLYSLLYTKQFVGKKIDKHLIASLVKTILESGIRLSNECKKQGYKVPPLMFEWHGSKYLAAAHGMAGIFYILFKVIKISLLIVFKNSLLMTLSLHIVG